MTYERHRRWFVPAVLLLAVAGGLAAQPDGAPVSPGVPHEHTPFELDGTPIVARVEMPLERPRRVLLDDAGHLYVVDSAAGRVVRRTADGELTTIAEGLDEPAGIAADPDGNLYVANHAGGQEGSGSIVRISSNGGQSVFAEGMTSPRALAFDRRGTLYVALFAADEIAAIDRDGRLTTFVRDIDAPTGLAFDGGGNLLVVGSTAGTLSRITPEREVTLLVRDLRFPTDVVIDSRGHAIVANYAGEELTDVAADGRAVPFASVPPGTIGLVLDADDNLYLANWDFRFVLRMTIHLSVPCPHCQKKIPVRIRPRMDHAPGHVF